MTRRVLLVLSLSLTLLMGGTASSPLQRTDIQRDLATLTQRGFTYRLPENDVIELTDPMSGEKHLKYLRESSEAQIRSWAAQRGIPILEIDPSTVDTSRFAEWYTYWGQLPISNGLGRPLVVGDVDRDGNAEVYGDSRIGLSFESRVYQIDSIGSPKLLYIYDPRPGISRQIADVDNDSLINLAFTYAGFLRIYEQPSASEPPTNPEFEYAGWRFLSPGFTGIYIGRLDADSLADYLYKGSECDSVDTSDCITKVYVAEYNSQIQNLIRVWSTDFDLNGNVAGVGGFAVDDFDGDKNIEFAVAELGTHRVFVVENNTDNAYAWTWQDSTPFVNLYYTVSGDVDHDGKPEFFVGATSNGSWTTMYEADSDNHYSAKFIIHLLSGGLLDEPTYLTRDVDGDGVLELAILSGNDLYIFKSRKDNAYYLWYLKREDTKDAVQFYDFNNDGRLDFIISKLRVDSLGRGVNYADYYGATSLVSVKEPQVAPGQFALDQNYPNPFNPSTRIDYDLPEAGNVTLVVYDVLGRRVAELAKGYHEAGYHSVTWNASNQASGVYIVRFNATDVLGNAKYSRINKLLLMK